MEAIARNMPSADWISLRALLLASEALPLGLHPVTNVAYSVLTRIAASLEDGAMQEVALQIAGETHSWQTLLAAVDHILVGAIQQARGCCSASDMSAVVRVLDNSLHLETLVRQCLCDEFPMGVTAEVTGGLDCLLNVLPSSEIPTDNNQAGLIYHSARSEYKRLAGTEYGVVDVLDCREAVLSWT